MRHNFMGDAQITAFKSYIIQVIMGSITIIAWAEDKMKNKEFIVYFGKVDFCIDKTDVLYKLANDPDES